MLVLHIGYAKAATTFLQKQVFPNIPDINYIGRSYGEGLSDGAEAKWVYDFAFEENISIDEFANKIAQSIVNKNELNVISHEVLLRPYKSYRLIKRISALKEYFGDIKIVLSIRNQTDIVLSRSVHDREIIDYKSISEALDFEGTTQCKWPHCSTRGVNLFKKGDCACRKAGVKFINVPFYNYLSLYCQLSAIFGSNSVHVIVSEALKDDCVSELNRLMRFLDIKLVDMEFVQAINSREENTRHGSRLYKEYLAEYEASGKRMEVFEYFKETNAVLSKCLQLSLDKYGYC